MKGWRPSARLKLETGSGSFKRALFLPDVGSIALSFSAGSAGYTVDFGFRPVSALEARGREVGPKRRKRVIETPSAIVKWRQPFVCFTPALRLLH